jgi:hypothetical protein
VCVCVCVGVWVRVWAAHFETVGADAQRHQLLGQLTPQRGVRSLRRSSHANAVQCSADDCKHSHEKGGETT